MLALAPEHAFHLARHRACCAGWGGEDAAAGIDIGSIADWLAGVVVAGGAAGGREVGRHGADGGLGDRARCDAGLVGAGRSVPDDVGAVSCHTVSILRNSPGSGFYR